jgi:polyketide synthase PksN
MWLFRKQKSMNRRGENMKDFLEYIFYEVKNKRLPKTDAVNLIRQFKTNSSSYKSCFLHPLLQKNTSDFSEQRFSSTFTGEEFFLADHVVKGQRVLPGVAYIEMARAAVEQIAGAIEESHVGIRLKNVVWAQPVTVADQPVQIHIGLYPEDTGGIAYEIYSDSKDDSEPIVHSQGNALLSAITKVPPLHLQDLQAQCSQMTLSSDQCYEAFKAMGLAYGPGHRGIEKLYVGQDQVLAKLSLPSFVSATQKQFALHPSLMDAALQSTIGFMMVSEDAGGKASHKLILPFALQEIEILDHCTSAMWALVRYSAGSKAGENVKKFDIDLCDEQGKVCVRMKEFSSRVSDGEMSMLAATSNLGTLMLQPRWKEQAVAHEVTIHAYDQQLILLCEPSEVFQENIEAQINGACCLTLQSEEDSIVKRFHSYAVQTFEEIQKILKDKGIGKVLIQILVLNQGEQQLFSGLSGLLKTAQLENPKIIGQLIEIESGEAAEGIVGKLKENSRSPMDNYIRYQDNKRYVAGWSEVDVFQEAMKIPWKDQGVYLITGGAGGLGLIFAEEIIHKVKDITLILTGRSLLNEDKQEKLRELESLGARIHYKQVDVTQKQEVVDLLQEIQEKFGSLHGIIHSAGVIKDNFILKKTKEELQAVLAPKVDGLVHLDQASKDLNLDFFVLFSSTTGTIGNPGQIDYATANAFMDAYAHYRSSLVESGQRQGRTLSINWPLWQEGGMSVDGKTERMMQEESGMIPMQTQSGIQALYQGLASGQAQVLAAQGNLKRIKGIFLEPRKVRETKPTASSRSEEPKAVPVMDQDLLQEKAENYFKKLLSSALKLPVHRIEADVPMEEYGIDSVMVMQLTNQLEKVFGSLSKTLLFEYQNIKELTGYFLESHRDQLAALLGMEERVAAASVSPDFAPEIEPEKPTLNSRRRSRFASMRQEAQPAAEKSAQDIAIIGLSGRYPGASNVQEFWQNLKDGRDSITEIPKDRWDYKLYFDEDKDKPGKVYSKWGGFLEGVDQFDPLFFNISPREAEIMDPQERLFLQCVYETLEDAGYTREALSTYKGFGLEGNVGVYVGVMYEEYQLYGAQEQIQGYPITLAGSPSSIANRISYFCNFHGPSIALDTMCSSSLTAIHLACQSLQRGGCELAIAGGVNVSIHPNKYLLLSQGKFVSSKGRCESFGQGGDGYVPGEGVGAVLLKPLEKAIADGDQIYGIIKGTAINHGGKTNGYTVPNPNAQAGVIGAALKEAGLDPRLISYIEAHGTGTSLGDPIEITGLTKAFQEYTKDKQYCAIGSAKSNIGHCESAAGIAGLTKVLLQLKHRQLVPSLHSEILNPHIDFAGTPFIVQQEFAEWKRPVVTMNGETREYPRIAGISSFGAGGANAHVVIEEYIPKQERALFTVSPEKLAIIVLSAKSEERLKEQSQQLLTAIQTQTFSDIDLADIAYTLQVGREAMEERLAITAVSLQELQEKLQAYLDGQENIDDLYRGQVKRNKETLAVFTADEELQEAISKWIQRGKYAKLLDLWAKGLSFDWNKLYPAGKPRRISLPTYPFAKEHYWVPEIEVKTTATSTTTTAFIHPLLHQNTSDLAEQRFTSTFTGQEFFLTDHLVKGRGVLPGVVSLEMARAAVQQATAALQEEKTQIQLQNIVWAHPITIEEKSVQVHIGLYPEETGQIAYEIYSQPNEASAESIVHSQGIAVLNTAQEAPVLNLSALQAECTRGVLSTFQLYEAFKKVGIDYGSAHQGVEQVYLGKNQVLTRLILPSSVTATQEQFILHPSLMDAALQASLGLMMDATQSNTITQPIVPFALDELEVFDSCTPSMWAHIRPSAGSTPGDRLPKLDIDLCNDQGYICVRMKAFTFRTLEGGLDSSGSSAILGTLMLQPCWREQPVTPEAAVSDYAQHLVILCESDNISPENITAQMNKVRCLPLKSSQPEMDERFQTYAVQVFEEIHNILKDKPKDKVLIQIVVSAIKEQQLCSGLLGLLKTAQLENPRLMGQLINPEPGQGTTLIIEQLKENSRNPLDQQIRYQDGKRFVAACREMEASTETMEIPWKDQGVYLITGGVGGLGLIFAEEIAHKVKDVTLILTGRSLLNEDKQDKLKELESLGARIHYKQVDVTQKQEVAELFHEIQEKFGSLHGIIHSAGMIKDNFIIKKTKEEFLAVLAPKVAGLVNLDQASQKQGLDFFIFFSSLAGSMGNSGQADYATANAFMDAYAHYRSSLVVSGQRHGKTLSINWPLWQEGGMRVDGKTERMMQEESGMIPMQTQNGIQALYQGLASGQAQMLVAEGNLKRIKAIFLEPRQFSEKLLTVPALREDSTGVPVIDQDWLQEKAENYFKKLLSAAIKLPVHRIEADAPMEQYGIDSVMVMQLINQLEKIFGSLSKTLLFEYQNIKELTGYFLECYRDQLTALLGMEERVAATLIPQDSVTRIEPEKPILSSKRRSRFASMRQEAQPEVEKSTQDIAIIGLSGRYPGASNVQEFWQNLKAGRDSITEIPPERWDYKLYFDENKDKPGTVYSKWGGFLEGVDQFDPLFFNISPREAEIMDPQERLFLQCVYETLEDAGYTREALSTYKGFGLEGNVGVYVGVMYEEYQLYGAQEQIQGHPITLAGSPSSIANRISYFCNFHGPSIALDTMCSSSLTAIHLACQSLQRGGCELAIAGGVNVSVHPNKYLLLSQGKFVSSKGRCESFGQGGDGYVPGEGVGAVLLKPLEKAIADGDQIYGIIKGTAINHGGKTNGYTVPNPNAQAGVIGAALKEAGLDPRLISYIEAHGTGTSLGDPIEITGLTKAFQEYTKDKQYCAIGSAKSNIGHCESAAGIAGLTKVLLQLKHRQLVPSLHSETLNPYIDFTGTPFIVQQEFAEWKRPVVTMNGETREYPRIAGISAFGAGGANAHVVVEEYIPDQEKSERIITFPKPAIIVLSAKNEDRLKEYSQQLLSAIQTQQLLETDLADIAYTLQVGREAMEERLAITAVSLQELKEKLQAYLDGQENIDDLYRGQVKRNKETLAIFTADEDMTHIINAWIVKGKYAKLLDLWAKGLSFDWNKLYPASKPRRTSLPTYPFAKERYWVPESKPASHKSPARVTYSSPVKNQKVILTKEWHEKTLNTKAALPAGVIVVLGTPATADLARILFKDTETIQVLLAIHGEPQLPAEIATDFYSSSAGESLYQQLKDRQKGTPLLGVIDITAYDSTYEQSTTVESGKITFLQKLIEQDRKEGYRLLQVTHRLHAFPLAKTTMQGARMAGLYRMLSAEYKQIQSLTMDSDCLLQDPETLRAQIHGEFLNPNTEQLTECCYRNKQRYEPSLTPVQTDAEIQKLEIPASYSPNDVLLLTGGSKGIGAAIAEHLVSRGAKNLIIMGKEDLPAPSEWQKSLGNKEQPERQEKIKRLQSLMDQGARVRYYNTSLTDEAGMEAMVQEIRQDWGPITGVFHCAGVVSKNPAFFKKALQDFETVCEPKMKGLVTLHQAVSKEPLEFFILFSSISSIAPSLASGQSDYAMANAYLDYYALCQAGEGKTYFRSIQWPAWGETGMATGGMRTPAYGETGLVSLTTADGLAFLEILSKKTPYIVSLPCVVVPGEFIPDHLLKNIPEKKESGQSVRQSLRQKPEVTTGSSVDLRTLVIQWLKQVFSAELKLTLAQLDDDKPFYEYGVESILLIQLTQLLQAKVEPTLDPALLLEHSTIGTLADYFLTNHAADLQSSLKPKRNSAAAMFLQEDSHSTDNASSPFVNAAFHSNSSSVSINQSADVSRPVQSAEEIAVVGLSCRFPGSPTIEAYWELLTKGVSAIGPVPKERWSPQENRQDYGGWIEDVDLFDPKFFNISEQDAAIMDPQGRIILEESLRAIYDAGYEHKQLSGQKIGVYIGGRSQPNLNINDILKAPNPILGMGQNYLATNISRYFNFKGPSLVVDTACSSGITGMLLACDSLREGRIDMGLVGAVSVLVSPYAHDLFAARNILSKRGEFHIFDRRSDGEVLGEGAGVVLLKRLSDAIKDGNQIYGVIKAIAENNDGQTLGPGSPNMNAQKQVMQEALTISGKQPAEIGYIEVNGGGSPVVDSIEIKALSEVYNLGNRALASCVIGSVKPNIGHLLLTSGLAGFIRCVLSVHHKQIPPFLSAVEPFAYYDFSSSRIDLNRKVIDWKVEPGKKRLAAQNSFPDGGTNCHLLIEEFVPDGIYQQQYFPKEAPQMTKKRFPLHSFSLLKSSSITKDTSKKQPDWKKKQHNRGAIPSLWGEYHEI